MDYITINRSIEERFLKYLTPHRVAHSRNTAELCRLMATEYGVSTHKAYTAGLAHDAAKQYSDEEIFYWASKYKPKEILEDEKSLPLLLHGRAAAGLIREKLGIKDEEILDAVTWHVSGTWPMSDLSKILYCADFLEPGREFIDDDYRKDALSGDLDHAVSCVLSSILRHRREKGHTSCHREKQVMKALHITGGKEYA